MLLHCVRHGETTFNASGRIQGQLDSLLSDRGREQCRATAAALRAVPIEAIYASPLRRARDSAEIIADVLRLAVEVDPLLMEINAGIFQGLGWDEIARQYPAESARWRTQDPDFRIPGGESRRDLMHRARDAFAAIRESGHRQVLIVAHGGILSAAFKVLLEIPAQHNPFNLQNGSISRMAWDGDVKLLSLNQIDHLHGIEGGGGDL